MITISAAILYVATKCLDQFIKEEGYGRIKKLLFPKTKYVNRLQNLIMEVLDEYAKADKNKYTDRIPFYHSPEVFQALIDHVLFKEIDLPHIMDILDRNPNVQPPEPHEVKQFFECFYKKVKSDSKLKKAFTEENYQAEIFNISSYLNKLDNQLTDVAKIVTSMDLKVTELTSASREHPVITGDYIIAPEEEPFNEILRAKNVLLLSGVSFCGKSQLAKKIAEIFVQEGYKYAGGAEVSEADRFLRNSNGNHIYLLEDPFGHNIESENKVNLRKVEELIRNMARGNKLIITSRSEVLLSAYSAGRLHQCAIDGHLWEELTIRDRDFLVRVWTVLSTQLPADCQAQIENHLKTGVQSELLQVGQLAHLSNLSPQLLSGKSLDLLIHMAKADARTLSLEIKDRSASSAHLYMVLGLAASTTQGISQDELAFILADSKAIPGLLKKQALRAYSSKRSNEVSFPKYDKQYTLSEEDRKEISFFVRRGYLEISNGQFYFKHPTYHEAARYLLLETNTFGIDYVLNKIERTLGCLNSKNAAYLARQLSFIYKGVNQDELKEGIRNKIYDLSNLSIFPSVRDWLLKFLLQILTDMDQDMQNGTFSLIDADMSSSDIFWEADQPFYCDFDRDFRDEDTFDEMAALQDIAVLSTTDEMPAWRLWSIVRLLSKPDFDLSKFPDEKGINRILNAEETFIRSKMASTVLRRMPSAGQKILDRIFNDANPWVVVEGIKGAIFGYPNYDACQRQSILPLLREALTNGFVIARIRTLLTSFGIDYGMDHIDWELIEDPDKALMWELWGILFPIFFDNMPVSVSIHNSGRFGQTMNASIEHLKNTTSGLKVAESFYRWIDARISNGLMPDTYELGVISYLLDISDNPADRLLLFKKIFEYPKSGLLLYSLSWAMPYWSELGEQEKQIILDIFKSNRKDSRWIVATAITRYEVPADIQQLLFGRTDVFSVSVEETIKIIGSDRLGDALEVYIGECHLFSWLGISHSGSENWHEIVKHVLVSGHQPGFELCLLAFIVDVINSPSLKWRDEYLDVWKTMCGRADLKDKLSDQLILQTARCNPSILPTTDLWKALIEACPGAEKVELAEKVAKAIEAMQQHDPQDILDFFDKEFLDMILCHCPLDHKILSTLLVYEVGSQLPVEVMDDLADEVVRLSKTNFIRLDLTFEVIKSFKYLESAHPRFSELEKLPNQISEKGAQWLASHRQFREIQDWIE